MNEKLEVMLRLGEGLTDNPNLTIDNLSDVADMYIKASNKDHTTSITILLDTIGPLKNINSGVLASLVRVVDDHLSGKA